MIWHNIAASIADLRHSSLDEKLRRLRQWCHTAYELYKFAGQILYFEPITSLLREQALAMLACVQHDAVLDENVLLSAATGHRGRRAPGLHFSTSGMSPDL